MPRASGLIPLSHDHHHGLRLAQLIKKNAPKYSDLPESIQDKAKYTIEFYYSDLLKHFSSEEEILYPFVKGVDESVDRLFKEIIEEHRQIREQIEIMEKESLKDTPALEDRLDELGRLLDSHIRKEERELFPRIEAVLDKEKLQELNGKINPVKK
ncbi:MAG: hemerythrin domain-containing protein [Ignavibacteriales bacterium]